SQQNRVYFSNDRTALLEEFYQSHISFSYPDRETIESLTGHCGISQSQIRKWFSNRR
ncbi:hypothetical protein HELRODRAFT_128632, partial [Helobdella robusta]|uniref:Homeobox domain-containing protein n=1 Tax=Helobdella robusta TaxID=6412 RepID=T1EHP4_HELRO